MKNVKLYFILLLSISSFQIFAQTHLEYSDIENKIKIEPSLINGLDHLLIKLDSAAFDSIALFYVKDKFTVSVLKEISYYEKESLDSTKTLKRKLINFHPIGNKQYFIQLTSSSIDDSGEQLELIWTLIADKSSNGYSFSSPLKYNTDYWNIKPVGKVTYHFRDSINILRAEKFSNKNIEYSDKFQLPETSFHFYMAQNYQEIMKIIGIDYCKSLVGTLRDGWGVVSEEFIFSVMNNEDFSHDLFHFYSGLVHETQNRNWIAEEGIAYSWGNAYYTQKSGEMAEQAILVEILNQYLENNPSTDLYDLFKSNFWNDTSKIYDELAPDFKVGRLLSSIICDTIEKQHGMVGLNQLIGCGRKPDRLTAFFDATNRLIGLNIENFNTEVQKYLDGY